MKVERYKPLFKEEKAYQANYDKLNEPRLITQVLDLLTAYQYIKKGTIYRIEPKLRKYLGKNYESYISMFGKFDPAEKFSDSNIDYELIRTQWQNYQRSLQLGQASKVGDIF